MKRHSRRPVNFNVADFHIQNFLDTRPGIIQKDHDGRISRDNKAWAQTVPVCEDKDGFGYDRNVYFVVDRCNPGLTDLFLSQARRECTPVQEQKPSVRDSLNKNAGQQVAHSNKTKVNKEQAR